MKRIEIDVIDPGTEQAALMAWAARVDAGEAVAVALGDPRHERRAVDLCKCHDQKDQCAHGLDHCEPHSFLRVDNVHQIHGVAHHDRDRKTQAQ